jgi:hypothetical protein
MFTDKGFTAVFISSCSFSRSLQVCKPAVDLHGGTRFAELKRLVQQAGPDTLSLLDTRGEGRRSREKEIILERETERQRDRGHPVETVEAILNSAQFSSVYLRAARSVAKCATAKRIEKQTELKYN